MPVCVWSCLTLCDSVDCSPPGSSVPGILQARILEWVAMPSSGGSSWPRDGTSVSWVSCIARGLFTAGKPELIYHEQPFLRHQKEKWRTSCSFRATGSPFTSFNPHIPCERNQFLPVTLGWQSAKPAWTLLWAPIRWREEAVKDIIGWHFPNANLTGIWNPDLLFKKRCLFFWQKEYFAI